ncbi:MAG: hypothetical protein IKA42_03245 [Clostridia bacterium]|nr:hypothetical protein [Clostridia bacterium]
MIKLICGEKGAGKTKKILDMANDTAKTSKGSVVFLDKDDSHKLGLSYKVRLNDMSEWRVSSDNELVAFIKGMLATNYDITDIFVDGIVKISGHPVEELANFFGCLERVISDKDVSVVLTISKDPAALPDFLAKYAQV